MRALLLGVWAVSISPAALSAHNGPTVTAEVAVERMRADVVRNGTPLIREIRDLTTGATVVPAPGDGWRGPAGRDVYDNFFANTQRWGGTPGRLNLASFDPNTLAPLCTDPLPLEAPYLRLTLDNASNSKDADGQFRGCAVDPNAFHPCSRNLDVVFDDYHFDPNTAGDPNGRTRIVRHRFLWTFAPDGPPPTDNRMRHHFALVDGFDVDQDGRLQQLGGYSVLVDWAPGGVPVAPGIYTFDVDLSQLPTGGIVGVNAGFFVYDVENHRIDAAGNPIPDTDACGTLWEWAKGWVGASAACDPGSTYTVGNAVAEQVWGWGSRVAGDLVTDPNGAVRCQGPDPGADGDPNMLSYEDVAAAGLVNIQFFANLPVGRVDMSHNVITTLTAAAERVCPGDVDRDGNTGLDDLLILLADFGETGFPRGDLDLSGSADLDDLLVLLGDFGCTG